jgi:hypothetical protein
MENLSRSALRSLYSIEASRGAVTAGNLVGQRKRYQATDIGALVSICDALFFPVALLFHVF